MIQKILKKFNLKTFNIKTSVYFNIPVQEVLYILAKTETVSPAVFNLAMISII